MVELIISLIAGAAGGNAAAKIFNSIDMGVVVNSIAGIVGGGIGGQIIAALLGGAGVAETAGATAGGLDLCASAWHIRRGGVGCGILLALVKGRHGALTETSAGAPGGRAALAKVLSNRQPAAKPARDDPR